jgi:TRAP-type C4-dicarboxylate transport system permease small subunit
VNRVRQWLVDAASLAFCGFFAWKSWTLLDEAWVEDYHSGSTWGPPLWIPYSLMTIGMTLLCLQLVLQVAKPLRSKPLGPKPLDPKPLDPKPLDPKPLGPKPTRPQATS